MAHGLQITAGNVPTVPDCTSNISVLLHLGIFGTSHWVCSWRHAVLLAVPFLFCFIFIYLDFWVFKKQYSYLIVICIGSTRTEEHVRCTLNQGRSQSSATSFSHLSTHFQVCFCLQTLVSSDKYNFILIYIPIDIFFPGDLLLWIGGNKGCHSELFIMNMYVCLNVLVLLHKTKGKKILGCYNLAAQCNCFKN